MKCIFYITFLILSANIFSMQTFSFNLHEECTKTVNKHQQIFMSPAIKNQYLYVLNNFKQKPSTFNIDQCIYLEQHIAHFKTINLLIHQYIELKLIKAFGLDQEKLHVLKVLEEKPSSKTFQNAERSYLNQLHQKINTNKEYFLDLKDNAVKEAASYLLEIFNAQPQVKIVEIETSRVTSL